MFLECTNYKSNYRSWQQNWGYKCAKWIRPDSIGNHRRQSKMITSKFWRLTGFPTRSGLGPSEKNSASSEQTERALKGKAQYIGFKHRNFKCGPLDWRRRFITELVPDNLRHIEIYDKVLEKIWNRTEPIFDQSEISHHEEIPRSWQASAQGTSDENRFVMEWSGRPLDLFPAPPTPKKWGSSNSSGFSK